MCVVVGGEEAALPNRVVREGFSARMIFEPRPRSGRGTGSCKCLGGAVLEAGKSEIKVPEESISGMGSPIYRQPLWCCVLVW
jgi:hypothetical protein